MFADTQRKKPGGNTPKYSHCFSLGVFFFIIFSPFLSIYNSCNSKKQINGIMMKNIKVKYLSDRGVWGGTGVLSTPGHQQVSARSETGHFCAVSSALGLRLSAGAPTSWLPPNGTRLSPTLCPR